MSSLVGLFHFDGGPVEWAELDAMGVAQAPYGPDLAGTWSEGHVGLGARLMRITPEDDFECQPLVSADGRRVLVFDGRVDNRPELATLLDISPSEARGLPDSAFVLRAYEKWGMDSAARLIGDFVWALWDRRHKRLLLARSPFSGRSVFFHVSRRRLAFSSRPKGLFALDSVPRAIDPAHLIDYLLSIPRDPGRTFFKDVSRLQAGHLLEVQPCGWHTWSYAQAGPRSELRLACDEEYVEAFDALLQRVVADQSRSRTPVGIMMSGGLDSTSIATIAAGLARARGETITAFTEVPRAGFDGPVGKGRYADETALVRAVAARHDNLESVLVRTDGRRYLDGLDTFLDAAEAPFPAASNRPWFEEIVRQSGGRGVRVLLSGGDGNLTISWNGQTHLPHMLASGHWLRAWREARSHRRPGRSTLRVLAGQGVVPLLPHRLWRTLQRLRWPDDALFATTPPWMAYVPIHPDFAVVQGIAERARAKGFDPLFRPPADTRRARLDTLTATGNSKADIGAGYEALFGVQIRDPARDVRLIDFCLAIPDDQWLREGQSRSLIRRAMRHRLPAEVLSNECRGLQAADWLERLQGSSELIATELERLATCNLVAGALDVPRLRQLVAGLPNAAGSPDRISRDYRIVLESGMMTGSFLDWFERGPRSQHADRLGDQAL